MGKIIAIISDAGPIFSLTLLGVIIIGAIAYIISLFCEKSSITIKMTIFILLGLFIISFQFFFKPRRIGISELYKPMIDTEVAIKFPPFLDQNVK
ncbi:hypothetical protein KJ708_08945, partial [bacterium]|nr:hypothetical protein [bacterium]